MARMIPSSISMEAAEKSPAEAKVFDWLKKMTWGNAIVLHSLPLKDHVKNSFGEIDFVVISDQGIICLEIKGGIVERTEGRWGFTNRHGKTNWKNEGPYTQAQGNMKSLRQYLEKRLSPGDAILECRYACCVMTPDCKIKSDDDTEVIPQITFNINMKESDIPSLFERCFHYWREEKHYGGIGKLSSNDRERLVTLLRGDFRFVPPLSVLIHNSEEQLMSITEEQYSIIQAMSINERMLVEGGAGTGKTVLAAEQCRRAAAAGEKVLYLCFNQMIGTYIKEVFESEGLNDRIDVYRFYELLSSKCATNVDDKDDSYYEDVLPNAFLDYCNDHPDGYTKYDRVIIDEGQDLMKSSAYLCINELIKGGWENGKWTIYYDPSQSLFVSHNEFDETWSALKQSAFVFPLTVNCRNTRQIALGNYAVTHVYKPGIMRGDGEEVAYIAYKNKSEEVNKLFDEIRRLRSEGLAKKDIVILSYYRADNPNSCLYNVTPPQDVGKISYNVRNGFLSNINIRFYTVQAFKGMESKAVIMIDVDNFSDEEIRMLNYVGMSRARSYLEFFFDTSLSEERQKRLLESLV